MVNKHVFLRTRSTFLLRNYSNFSKRKRFSDNFRNESITQNNKNIQKKLIEWQRNSLLHLDKNGIIKKYFELLQKKNVPQNLAVSNNTSNEPTKLISSNLSYSEFKEKFFDKLKDIREIKQESQYSYGKNIDKLSKEWLDGYLVGHMIESASFIQLDSNIKNYVQSGIFHNVYNNHSKLGLNWEDNDKRKLRVGDFVMLSVTDSSNVIDKFKIGMIIKLPYENQPDVVMYCSDGELYYLNPKNIILKIGQILMLNEKTTAMLFSNLFQTQEKIAEKNVDQEFLSSSNLDLVPKVFQSLFNAIYVGLRDDVLHNYHRVGYFMNKIDLAEFNTIESLYTKIVKKINSGEGLYQHSQAQIDASLLVCILLQLISKNYTIYTNNNGTPINFALKSNDVNGKQKSNAIFNYISSDGKDISTKLNMVEKLLKMNVSSTEIGKLKLDTLYEQEQLDNGKHFEFAKNPFYANEDKSKSKNILTEDDVSILDVAPEPKAHFQYPVYCIDSADTFEVDDGLSIECISDLSFRIHCHIASVGRFFLDMENNETKKQIFEEALKASTTLYLPDTVEPMFKEKSIIDYYSLNPERQDNRVLTFSIDLKCTNNNKWMIKKNSLKFKEYDFVPNIKRLTYEEADAMIECNSDLKKLYELSEVAGSKRKRGSRETPFGPKVSYKINKETQEIKKYTDPPLTKSRYLVSELMLLFNSSVSEFCKEKKIPIIYRSNDKGLVQESTISMPYLFNKSKLGAVNPVNPLIFEYPPSLYTEIPKGHFALKFKQYTHVTSPLRRIVDAVNHVAILKFVRKAEAQNFINEQDNIKQYVNKYINSAMKSAKSLTNKSTRYYELQSLKQNNCLNEILKNGGVIVDSPKRDSSFKGDSDNSEDSSKGAELPSDDIEIRRSISVTNIEDKYEIPLYSPNENVIIGTSKPLFVKFENGVFAKLQLSKSEKEVKIGDRVSNLKLERLDAIAGDFYVSL